MKSSRYLVRWMQVEETSRHIKVPFSQVVLDFLAAKRLVLSPHTMTDYGLTLRRAGEFFTPDPFISEIGPRHIRDFLATIPGGKKNRLNAQIGLSSLWTFAVQEGYCDDHVVRRVEKVKPEQRVIVPYSKLEVNQLLNNLSRDAQRDQTIILVLLDSGLRASELCGLKIGDMRGNYLKVMGKGSKEREVPVSAPVLQAILDYLASPRKPGKFIFQSESVNHLTPNSLLQAIYRIAVRAGVKNADCHRFRHTFAINYLLNGGDPYTLQKILGHATLDMVRRYLAIVREDLARVHAKASPVENWGLTLRVVKKDAREAAREKSNSGSHP